MIKQLLTTCLAAASVVAFAGGGGPVTPGAFSLDSAFNGLSNAKFFTVNDTRLSPLGITEDASGNVWFGGFYEDDVNHFQKGFIGAVNGSNGNLLTTYNSGGSMPGMYFHNQYDFAFPLSMYSVRGGKVYAAFSFPGGAIVDTNSNGLGANKIDFNLTSGKQCKAYAQRNDSTIIGVTRSSSTSPLSNNNFYSLNAVKGTDFATHRFTNYYNANANSFQANLFNAQQVEIQPDGKMLVAATPYELYRFKANSSELDSTFGVNGYSYITPVPLSGGSLTHRCVDILVQANGKILYMLGAGNYNLILQLNADGTQDLSFNNNQQYLYESLADNAGSPARFTGNTYVSMAQLSDGKFVVLVNYMGNQEFTINNGEIPLAKLADASANSYIILKSYNADGTRDYTFAENTSYEKIIHLNNNNSTCTQATEIYVGANDNIYICGRTRPNSGSAITESAFVIKLKKNTVANPCASFQLTTINSTPATAANSGLGSVSVKVSGGIAPYSYNVTLSGGAVTNGNLSGDSATITLSPENNGYDIVVTDANNCTVNGNAVVASCLGITANSVVDILPTSGQCDAELIITISGNSTGNAGPYTLPDFTNGGNPFQAPSSPFFLGGLCDDSTYIIEIKTGYDCVVFDTVAINDGNGCVAPPSPTITQSNDTLFASTVGVTGGYDWYKDGGIINTTNFPTNFISTSYGNGSYTVVAGNGVGCVSPVSSPYVLTGVGIKNIVSKLQLSLYPNPVSEFLVINCNEQIETTEVYNMIGEKVISAKGQITKLNTAALTQGVYTLQLKTTIGNTATKKFMKQ